MGSETKELTARDTANQLHDLIKHIKISYEAACEEIAFCEGESKDLNHALEFFEDDEDTEREMLLQFRDNRRRRREAKNRRERWFPLYEIVTDPGNNIQEKISAARRMVQSIIKTQSVRRYTVRARKDLQADFDRAARAKQL
jgi:hypothetical protein